MTDDGRGPGPDSGPAPERATAVRTRGASPEAQLTVDALLARSRGAAPAPGRRRADRRAPVTAPPARPSSSAPRPSTTTPPPSPRPTTPPAAPQRVTDAEPVVRQSLPPAPPVVEPAAPSAARPAPAAPAPAGPPAGPPAAGPAAPTTSELPATGIVRAPGTTSLPAQTGGPRPTLPPVPEPDHARPSAPVPALPGTERAQWASAAAPAGAPAAAAPAVAPAPAPAPPARRPGRERGVRHSGPVPPLPGTERVRHSGPVPPLPPLPGARPATPLPPIPGRDVPPTARERAPMSPLRRRLVRVAVVLGVLLGLVAGFYVGLYFYADRAMTRVAALSPQAPEVFAPGAQDAASTWLVLGTGGGTVAPTLLRVAPDDGSAVVVDLPATALVDTPECRTADGGLRAPVTEALADAYAQGGPSCLVRAVQQVTGLRVDHLLSVDLGRTGAPASCPTDALPVADLALLLNPVRATSVLVDAAHALTVDEGTSLGDLRTLAATLRDLPAASVERTALPVQRVGYVPAGGSSAEVLLDGAATRAMVESVLSTGRLPDTTSPQAEPAVPAEGASVTLAPAGIPVQVLDATGAADPASGPGATVAAGLTAQGFAVPAVALEPAATPVSLVRYAPELAEQARTVAAAVPGAVLEPSAATGGGIQLVVASPDLAVAPVAVGAAVPVTAPSPAAPTATCG